MVDTYIKREREFKMIKARNLFLRPDAWSTIKSN